jgi:hypothetical protein
LVKRKGDLSEAKENLAAQWISSKNAVPTDGWKNGKRKRDLHDEGGRAKSEMNGSKYNDKGSRLKPVSYQPDVFLLMGLVELKLPIPGLQGGAADFFGGFQYDHGIPEKTSKVNNLGERFKHQMVVKTDNASA